MRARFVGGPLGGERRVIPSGPRYYVAAMPEIDLRPPPDPSALVEFQKHRYDCEPPRGSILDGDPADPQYEHRFFYRGIE